MMEALFEKCYKSARESASDVVCGRLLKILYPFFDYKIKCILLNKTVDHALKKYFEPLFLREKPNRNEMSPENLCQTFEDKKFLASLRKKFL